jgi:renalase
MGLDVHALERDIVMIGSGLAGLACTRQLKAVGLVPLVLDKCRAAGGRMATRRVEIAGTATGFVHGAQYFTIHDPDFRHALAPVTGASVTWEDGTGEARSVGQPGISSVLKALADGLDLHQGIKITALLHEEADWRRKSNSGPILARHVPMAPCLTLMAAFPAGCPLPSINRLFETEPLAWIVQDSSEPGRNPGFTCWVAPAGPDGRAAHLEVTPESLACLMLPLLARAIGAEPGSAVYAAWQSGSALAKSLARQIDAH